MLLFSSLSLSNLELNDTKIYEPSIRALLGTASNFCEVVVLKLGTDQEVVRPLTPELPKSPVGPIPPGTPTPPCTPSPPSGPVQGKTPSVTLSDPMSHAFRACTSVVFRSLETGPIVPLTRVPPAGPVEQSPMCHYSGGVSLDILISEWGVSLDRPHRAAHPRAVQHPLAALQP